MNNDRRTISLGFSHDPVQEGLHACYVYNDDTERLRIMAKYMQSGLLTGEKLLYLVDLMTPAEMVSCLEELGVDVQSGSRSLAVADAASSYCPSGSFSADEMLENLRTFYDQAIAEDYPGARVTGEMSWSLTDGLTTEEELIEYEAQVNLLVSDYPITACCQYDARRFDGETIMNVLSVHPVMILRGQLVQNPFYVEPTAFLKEYRERHTSAL